MGFDPAEFKAVTQSDTNDIVSAVREVTVPVCTDDGYTTVDSKQFYHRDGDEYICVRRVSDAGWSVWHYTAADGEYTPVTQHGTCDSCQAAQRLARRVLTSDGSNGGDDTGETDSTETLK